MTIIELFIGPEDFESRWSVHFMLLDLGIGLGRRSKVWWFVCARCMWGKGRWWVKEFKL